MKSILAYLKDHPAVDNVLNFLINAVLVIAVAFVILRVSRKLFQKIQNRKTKFNTQFTEKIFRFLVIFISIMWLVMSNSLTRSFGQSLFQSTAVIAAIAGFAAQNVLADLICGIILSSTKPFEPGDRIELENGITGIVKEVTLRHVVLHVVLQGIDTQIYIVPNSKINAQYVRNLSYRTKTRSVDFHFSVSYRTDPEFAKEVIRRAVMDSPLSVPGKKHGKKEPGTDTRFFVNVPTATAGTSLFIRAISFLVLLALSPALTLATVYPLAAFTPPSITFTISILLFVLSGRPILKVTGPLPRRSP